jgi:hypothetical protein
MRTGTQFADSRADARMVATSLGQVRALRKHYEGALADARGRAASAIRSTDTSLDVALSRSVAILMVCLLLAVLTSIAAGRWLFRPMPTTAEKLVRRAPARSGWSAGEHR